MPRRTQATEERPARYRFDRIVELRDWAGGATMTTVLFVRRFLADSAHNPVSLLVLVLVPLVFVAAGAGPLADAAQLLRGSAAPPRWKPPPPGGPPGSSSASPWTPGFRGPPRRRRLVIASLPANIR